MKKDFYDNYIEIIELMPKIQHAAILAVERDKLTHVFNPERIRRKARLYKDLFELIQGKWTVEIFYTLMMYTECGFNDIKRALPELNSRTLTDRLLYLENRRIISRTIKSQRPIRVSYALTEYGREGIALLVPFLLYLTLPRRFRKDIPKITEIEDKVKEIIESETEELQKIWHF